MKRGAAILVLLSFLSVLASAQDTTDFFQSTQTMGLPNGRLWKTFSDPNKVFYLRGAMDTFIYRAILGVGGKPVVADFGFAQGYTLGDFKEYINSFYAQPENIRMPILFVVRIGAMKFDGRSSKDIDAELETMRQLIAANAK